MIWPTKRIIIPRRENELGTRNKERWTGQNLRQEIHRGQRLKNNVAVTHLLSLFFLFLSFFTIKFSILHIYLLNLLWIQQSYLLARLLTQGIWKTGYMVFIYHLLKLGIVKEFIDLEPTMALSDLFEKRSVRIQHKVLYTQNQNESMELNDSYSLEFFFDENVIL